jgi:hypothetical protein
VDKHITAFPIDHKPVTHPAVEPLYYATFHGEAALGRAVRASCAVELLKLGSRRPADLDGWRHTRQNSVHRRVDVAVNHEQVSAD